MTLSNSASENQSQAETSRLLSKEAQARVDIVSSTIIDIIKQSTDGERIVLNWLNENLRRELLSNPGEVAIALNAVEQRYQESLPNMTKEQMEAATKNHISYLEKTCSFINSCAQNIQWDNEFKALKGKYNDKKTSLLTTYAGIIANDHPDTQSA